jgi:lipocalin
MLMCGLLPNPAQAQFFQQGPKLVGAGAIGGASQGYSVSLSGDGNTAIVGGPGYGPDPGAAWVFTRSAGVWSQQGTKLVGTDAVGLAEQGRSVALSADGTTAIVGGPADNGLAGAAWVFTRSAGVWSQQDPKLVGTGAIGDAFQGWSVALSADGNTAIVGGFNDNPGNNSSPSLGAAWVFTRSAGVWSQQGPKLVGTDAVEIAGFGVEIGYSVSLSADGNTAIVGGYGDNAGAGAAWVFTRSPEGVWSQQGPKLVGTGAVGAASIQQGHSVALSGDGNTAISGGPEDDGLAGAAWVFTRSAGVWSQQGPKLVGTGATGGAQGWAVSLSSDGDTAIVGGPNDGHGAAWVFTRSAGVWSQQGAKLVGTGAATNTNPSQGFSVALSGDGDTALVGGPTDDFIAGGSGGVSFTGAAWVFAPFAGTPGTATCVGQSITTLIREFGGLSAAAADVDLSGVPALQKAVLAYCG